MSSASSKWMSVRVDRDLHNKASYIAAASGTTVRELVTNGLQYEIGRQEQEGGESLQAAVQAIRHHKARPERCWLRAFPC